MSPLFLPDINLVYIGSVPSPTIFVDISLICVLNASIDFIEIVYFELPLQWISGMLQVNLKKGKRNENHILKKENYGRRNIGSHLNVYTQTSVTRLSTWMPERKKIFVR